MRVTLHYHHGSRALFDQETATVLIQARIEVFKAEIGDSPEILRWLRSWTVLYYIRLTVPSVRGL